MKILARLGLIASVLACGCGGGGGAQNQCGADVTTPVNGDGCCTMGANANTDSDCTAVCGNDVQEMGESCDDGNTTPGDGCDGSCVLEVTPTAFRIDSMTMADPHPFAAGILDVTDTVHMLLSDSITMDGTMPPDGKLDLSIVPVFRPLDQSAAAATPLDIVFADCTAPVASTTCTRPAMGTVVSTTVTNADGTCLEPLPGSTGGYMPAVVTPTAPCFASAAASFDVTLGGIVLPLKSARIAASYTGNPATMLTQGLIMGFVTKADADAIILPADLLAVGGKPLSNILKASDMDTGPSGEMGWWFYLNFTASPVTYSD
jgi:cysteine-rich repeat protein